MAGNRSADAIEVQARDLPGRIGGSARCQVEVDKRKVDIRSRVKSGRLEREVDLVAGVQARRALDLIQAKVVAAHRRAGAVVAAGVVDRNVDLERPGPREDVRLIDPVFDNPPELGVARTPAPGGRVGDPTLARHTSSTAGFAASCSRGYAVKSDQRATKKEAGKVCRGVRLRAV